jgi:glycosyltransferase involved in cell wall biosynthesis
VRIACVPMWEALDELSPWIRDVDLFICPTRHCRDLLRDWRDRLDLPSGLALVPWPIELDRFPFHPRTVCRRFLFVHGFGGARIRHEETPDWDGRKGLAIVAEAARRAPSVPIVVRSQWPELPPLGENVELVCGGVADPAELYEYGDVCLQPSRWEGLGLPLLECQASGLPLITTDAPPMNEHRALATLPARARKVGLDHGRTIVAHDADPALLAETLRRVHGSDVSEASRAARRFVESEHSWSTARLRLLELFSTSVNMLKL